MIMSEKAPSDARVLIALSLLSGMGSVVYEVIYMRDLSSVLGDMYYVHATLLSVFLFGLGLGALLAQRLRRWLFAIEAFIGLWAISFPLLVSIWVQTPMVHWLDEPLLYTILSVVVLLSPPAIAIGFSVPLFSHYVEGQGEREDAFGLTYYAYNFGACVSILLVEIAIIRHMSHAYVLMSVAALNFVCAIALFLRRHTWVPADAEHGAHQGEVPQRRDLLALSLLSFSSAIFHGFFIIVAYNLLRPYRENFALCTAAVLLGIALGADLARRTSKSFGFLAAAAALSIALMALLAPLWPLIYDPLTPSPGAFDMLHRFVALFLLGGIPYIFLGAAIPALVKGKEAMRSSGLCLFISGCANVLGFFGYVFIIHPRVHVFWAVVLIVLLLMGSAMLAQASRRERAMGAVAIALASLTLLLPERAVYLVHSRTTGQQGWHSEFLKDASDVVTLSAHPDGRMMISYNGHPSIVAREAGKKYNFPEVLSGLLSAPLAPSTQRAMVLGMGTGMTAGSAAQVYEQVDVVEINEAFWEITRRLAPGNFSLIDNPHATLHHDDGRRFLIHAPDHYDAIINSIPSPRFAAASKVYTVEFFEYVRARLKPGGVYATWFTAGDMSPDGVQTLLSSLAHVFEHCQLSMLRKGYYFLTCSNQELVRRELATLNLPPDYVAQMQARLGTTDLEAYVRAVDLSGDIFARERPHSALNRDAYPLLEYQVMDFYRHALERYEDVVLSWQRAGVVHTQLSADEPTALHQADILFALYPELFELDVLPQLRQRGLLERSAAAAESRALKDAGAP